ncbi:MAG: asparagine synthetase B [Sphingomonas sp.]|nr:asparagine synthetase B [Sphingomonas sp.]
MLKSQAMYGQHSADWSDGEIGLGRHLFRILPEDQRDLRPQLGGDGTLVLVADVRLDNRDELAAALGLTAPVLRPMPDVVVLMRALEAWGEDAIARLVGDFAFALWDARRRRLLLARDYLGQRPLHYHRGRDFFAFASMPKGLHALPDVPLAPDPDAVADFIALLPETGTASFFKGIQRVQPGHLVRVSREGISTQRYWVAPTGILKLKDDREYEEAVRVEMDRAVASRLRGVDGKVGSHLSGGLDSSTVAATAARQLAGQGQVIAYTSAPREGYIGGFSNSISDEFALAASVAALYGNVEHVKIAASRISPLEPLDRYFYLFDRPYLNLCNGVWVKGILDDARARGLRVMLSGDAGNMTFSYDGMAALSKMLREGRLASLARTAFSLATRGTRLGTLGAQIVGPFLPRVLWAAILQVRGKSPRLTDYTLINPVLEPSLARAAVERGLDFSYRPRSDPHSLRTWVLERVDAGNYNKGYLGGWGVDVRDPTGDRRLFELCLTIPPEQFLAGGVPRSLARRTFADRLSPAVTSMRKKGYQAADWHEALTNARSEVDEEVERSSKLPLVRGLLSTEKMRQLVRDWPHDRWNEDEVIEKYRLALLRGTSAAHFVRRASGSNV